MLEDMRRHSRSTLIYVLFGILIAVFILTFNTASRVGSAKDVENEVLADVSGTTIDNGELSLAMLFSADPPPAALDQFQKFQAKQTYEGTRFWRSGGMPELVTLTPHQTVPSTKIEKVMAELVESVLVGNDAKAHGLSVSDIELARRVMALQRANGSDMADENGNFDPARYDRFVRYGLGTSKGALEDFLRREILRDKMAMAITQGIVASPQEIEALYNADAKRPRLEVLTLDAASAAKAVTVTDAEADAYAAAHAAAIATEYKAQEGKYKVPDKYNVRGILIAAAGADDSADEAKKKEAADQMAAKRGAAEAIKADLQKAWNGDVLLDPIAPKSDDPDKPALAVGEPKTATQVTGDEKNQRLLGYFSKVAKDKSEDSIYKDEGGKYVDDYDAEGLARQPFGPEVRDAVLAAGELQLVGPVQGKKGWWLLVVEKKLPGKITPQDVANREIARGLVQKDKGEKEMDNIAKAVLLAAQATATSPLADVVKAYAKKQGLGEDALSVSETPPLGKSPMESLQDLSALFGGLPKTDGPDDVPGVGHNPELAKAAWALKDAAPLAGQVFKSEDGKTRYVVRLASAKAIDAAAEQKSKDMIAKSLTQLRRREAYRSYVVKLVTEATAAGKIKPTTVLTLKIKEEVAKLADEQKKAGDKGGDKAAAPGGMQFKIGDQQAGGAQPIKIDLGGAKGGDAPAKAGEPIKIALPPPGKPEAPTAPTK